MSNSASIDRKEFLEVVEKNQGIIHRICNHYSTDEDQRKDLFQEIMFQLWRSYSSFKGQSTVGTWLYRVAFNTACTQMRNERVKRDSYAYIKWTSETDTSIDQESRESVAKLYKAIDLRNPAERAIILMHLDELPNDEIAQVIGSSATNVALKLTRIRQKLGKILNNPKV
jgi:RNA polymerase sigma-70 factor (ECF subfamily)